MTSMVRQRRIHIPGSYYHIMLRGNDKQKIFFDDHDRYYMLKLIREGVESYQHKLNAFCLMSNHIHLLVQASHIPFSKIIHNLAFRYCLEINKRYEKVGHLFQGRFKSIILDRRVYFLKLLRYIHMNPVRAKMVKSADDYRWSSHRAYLGKEVIPWLNIEDGLSEFDSVLGNARKLYYEYILQTQTEEELNELRLDFKDGYILGKDDFLDKIRIIAEKQSQQNVTLQQIVESACEIFDTEKTKLCSKSQERKLSNVRGAIVMIAQESGISLEEVALFFERDSSTLCSLNKRFTKKVQEDTDLQLQVEIFRNKIRQLSESEYENFDESVFVEGNGES